MEAAFDPAYGEAWTRRQVGDALVLPNTHYLLCGPDGAEPGDGEHEYRHGKPGAVAEEAR